MTLLGILTVSISYFKTTRSLIWNDQCLKSACMFASCDNIIFSTMLLCEPMLTRIARFMGPTWGPAGAYGTQVGPILAPWTLLSGDILLIWPAGTHSSEILINKTKFSFREMYFKMLSVKYLPFCPGLNNCFVYFRAQPYIPTDSKYSCVSHSSV